MSIRIGLGIDNFRSGSPGATIAAIFSARVATDGGTYEANSCLVSQINTLLNTAI